MIFELCHFFTSKICTSVFLDPVWLDGYFTINFANQSETLSLPGEDFRRDGLYKFYNLYSLCQLANSTIAMAQAVFVADEFITAQALPRMYTIKELMTYAYLFNSDLLS